MVRVFGMVWFRTDLWSNGSMWRFGRLPEKDWDEPFQVSLHTRQRKKKELTFVHIPTPALDWHIPVNTLLGSWRGNRQQQTVESDLRTCRSQWPRGLRHELSSPAQTLGSWVRIPLEAWMSGCVYSVFVLFCVQVAALRRADPPSKESYRLCKKSRNRKIGRASTKGCKALDK
jgi:hypothetical protein